MCKLFYELYMSNYIQIAKRNLEDQFYKAESKIKGDIKNDRQLYNKFFF